MAASLFDEIKSLAPPEVIERLSGALGETPQATDRALTGAAMPAVLGGLVQQFSSGAGPARLLGLIKQQDPNGKLLDNLPAGGLGEAERAGQGVIGALFGSRADHVADGVAAHAEIRKSSATSLLSLAGAMILGFLGQRVARGGLDADGLGAMLQTARGELGRITPPGFAAAIGAPAAATEPTRERSSQPRERADTYAASAAGARDAIYRDKGAVPSGGRRGTSWLLPLLILLGLAAWLISRFHGGGPQVPSAPAVQGPATPGATPTAARTAPVRLPGGVQLNLATNSVAYGLASYLGNPGAPAPQRFVFHDLSFPAAGGALSGASQGALNDVAAVLRAYPNARVQVEGFTDNAGAAQANLALSQQRANAVRMALIQRGVAPERVSARGFGQNNAIASNATPAGRAMNRRTDLVVVSR